ncbi:transcriptional regulator of RNA polII, SAGA, subunit-domain-containing protein, partial [Dissophora ornata]
APLHNQFILANIHNAQKDAPPPSKGSVGWGKGKKDKDGKPLKEKDPRRRKIKNQILSLGKSERERIKSLKDQHKNSGVVKQRLKEHRISKSMAPVMTQQSQVVEYNRGAHAPLCFDSKELPDFESMKDRMTAVAIENGLLGGVQDGSVELMLHALESHIKNIISNCIIKLRTNRALGITVPKRDLVSAAAQPHNAPSSSSSSSSSNMEISSPFQNNSSQPGQPSSSSSGPYQASYNNNGHNPKRTTTITAKDLAFTIDISPNMLVENPVNVEKLLSILMEEDSEEEDEDAEMDDQDKMSNWIEL